MFCLNVISSCSLTRLLLVCHVSYWEIWHDKQNPVIPPIPLFYNISLPHIRHPDQLELIPLSILILTTLYPLFFLLCSLPACGSPIPRTFQSNPPLTQYTSAPLFIESLNLPTLFYSPCSLQFHSQPYHITSCLTMNVQQACTQE